MAQTAVRFTATAPCADCPWRKDLPVGRFAPARLLELRAGTPEGGHNVIGCHKVRQTACVGAMLVEGKQNAGVRFGLVRANRDYEALRGRERCFASFEEMLAANGVTDEPAVDSP